MAISRRIALARGVILVYFQRSGPTALSCPPSHPVIRVFVLSVPSSSSFPERNYALCLPSGREDSMNASRARPELLRDPPDAAAVHVVEAQDVVAVELGPRAAHQLSLPPRPLHSGYRSLREPLAPEGREDGEDGRHQLGEIAGGFEERLGVRAEGHTVASLRRWSQVLPMPSRVKRSSDHTARRAAALSCIVCLDSRHWPTYRS
jgi:hypothetical protein